MDKPMRDVVCVADLTAQEWRPCIENFPNLLTAGYKVQVSFSSSSSKAFWKVLHAADTSHDVGKSLQKEIYTPSLRISLVRLKTSISYGQMSCSLVDDNNNSWHEVFFLLRLPTQRPLFLNQIKFPPCSDIVDQPIHQTNPHPTSEAFLSLPLIPRSQARTPSPP